MEIADIVQQAKKALLKQGGHRPQLIIEAKGIYISVLDFLPETTLEKKMLLFRLGHGMAMEHDIEVTDVKQLIWICEAWFSKVSFEEYPNAPAPSKDPNRQEGLIVLMLSITGKQLSQEMRLVEIIRHGSTVDLLPRNDKPDDVKSGLLTSCLAGIVSASISESELAAIIRKAAKE